LILFISSSLLSYQLIFQGRLLVRHLGSLYWLILQHNYNNNQLERRGTEQISELQERSNYRSVRMNNRTKIIKQLQEWISKIDEEIDKLLQDRYLHTRTIRELTKKTYNDENNDSDSG
jgi:chromosome segregation ATPase